MSISTDGLEALSEELDAMLQGLTPARRKAAARKIGQQLRRANTARIAANIQPDGSPMEPRKPRDSHKGRIRRAKMFRKLRLARNLQIRPDPSGVELRFRTRSMEQLAAEHHYGLEGKVGETKTGRRIRSRFPERRLLGFSKNDLEIFVKETRKLLV